MRCCTPLAGDSSPPDIHVESKRIAAMRDGFRAQFAARNAGGEPPRSYEDP